MFKVIQVPCIFLAVASGLCGSVAAAPVELSNASTKVVVNGGEASNGLVPYNGYFQYTDLGSAVETTWSTDPVLRFGDGSTAVLSAGGASGLGSPSLVGVAAESSATSSFVSTLASTVLVGSNARTTFTFTSATGALLDGTTFVFYAENDIFGFGDDTAAFSGSIAGGDLKLFQYDTGAGGITVRLTGEATSGSVLSMFGSGLWTGFGAALETGDLSVLSADGSNFAVGPGDLGLAMAFSLSGTTATVVINYDTQPAPPGVIPEPGTSVLAALAIAALAVSRRKRASLSRFATRLA